MIRPQLVLDLNGELIVDLYAGGGGVSIAIEIGTGRHVDIAGNHSEPASAMHRANHPQTVHKIADIWEIDPREATQGRPVGLLHFSPDCTDHSQAAAGQPRDKKIRSLAWVGLWWAGTVRPRVITLENVKQMRKWGPLIAKRCKETGRVIKKDGSVAAKGEVVPVRDQYLIADPKRLGQTWTRFKRRFRELGYEWNDTNLVASEYGAPTSRERLFGIARCDGGPVTFPEPTHFKNPKRGQLKMREAWECIDFSIPCPSVLLTKAEAKALGFKVQRPLKPKSCYRLAKGTKRFVIDAAEPFIVSLTHAGGDRLESVFDPFKTITGANRGEKALAMPFLAWQQNKGGARSAEGQMHTITGSDKDQNQVCAAFVARQFGTAVGHEMTVPNYSVMGGGGKNQVVCAHLVKFNENSIGGEMTGQVDTVMAGAPRHGVVAHFLAQNNEGEVGHPVTREMPTIVGKGSTTSLVACSLVKYYGVQQAPEMTEPLDAATTKARFALSMAELDVPPLTPEKAARARQLAAWLREYGIEVPGEFAMCGPFVIWDLGMRMFEARELYNAQGFPPDYIIDYGIKEDGSVVYFTKAEKILMCGNSVSPPPYIALIRHAMPELNAYFDGERRAA